MTSMFEQFLKTSIFWVVTGLMLEVLLRPSAFFDLDFSIMRLARVIFLKK